MEVPNWEPRGRDLGCPCRARLTLPGSLIPPEVQEQYTHFQPASTSSASNSVPLPTSAMFLLRLPPPKSQTGSSEPTRFLGSGLSPASAREERGGPVLPPGRGRGQQAFPALGAGRLTEHPFPKRGPGRLPLHKLRPLQASPRPHSSRVTNHIPSTRLRLQPASAANPRGRGHSAGGVTSWAGSLADFAGLVHPLRKFLPRG